MADGKFKQLCFNELSLEPLCKDEKDMVDRISGYTKTLKAAQEVCGTKWVRYYENLCNIQLDKLTSLQDYCNKHLHEPGVVAILSSQTMPQIDEKDEAYLDKYVDTRVSLQKDGISVDADGMTAAYVYDTSSIGFNSDEYWRKVMHDVHVISGGKEMDIKWPCLTSPEHLLQDDFKHWMQEHSEVKLVKTTLPIANKQIHLRDDHGKEILETHAKSLMHNEYVEGVLTSLPFNPSSREYVDRVTPDGLVDVVLYWTDSGLSMRVKTTGRNIQETRAIAALLKEKYGK